MKRWRSLSVLVLAVTAVYLFAFPTATLVYAGAVLLHTGLGLLVTLALAIFLFRGMRSEAVLAQLGWVLMAAGAVLGVALIYLGTPHRLKAWLYAHIAICTLGAVLLAAAWMEDRGWLGTGAVKSVLGLAGILLAAAGIAAGAWWVRNVAWNSSYRVTNPAISPATMENEGDGPKGKFFPSSVQTKDGNYIPSGYFLQS